MPANIERLIELIEALGGGFESHIINLQLGLCPTCGNPVGEFRNPASQREFNISKMCQACQDEIFGVD